MKNIKSKFINTHILVLSTYLLTACGGGSSISNNNINNNRDDDDEIVEAKTPEGIGNCQKTSGNWFPPDGANTGSFTGWTGHPCTQPHPGGNGFFGSQQVTTGTGNDKVTRVITPEGQFEKQSPFDKPPGSNFLNSVDSNLYDFLGNEMPNTLPSRIGESEYLLHAEPVTTQIIDKESPADALRKVYDALKASESSNKVDEKAVQFGLDVLEGNPIPGKAYSGFAMLNYNGPNKVGVVEPIYDNTGKKIGGNLNVNMIYWDQYIKSDTIMVDPSAVQDVPWTVTYNINILRGGIEDFSPMQMYFDVAPNGKRGPFHASMDQSYFPMLEEGTKYRIKIKQSKGKYYNLTYTWGWRIHPPRVQVMENTLKKSGGKTLLKNETDVFGINPQGGEAQKLAAIAKIGDLAPAKTMWNLLRAYVTPESGINSTPPAVIPGMADAFHTAFLDWNDRTRLPTGVTADPDATITLLYANNTIYGSKQGTTGTGASGDDSGQGPAAFKGISNGSAHDWNIRPYEYKVTLLNADNFEHAYMNVDFGGSRGWENLYQDTDPTTALADHAHTEDTVILGDRSLLVDHVLLDNNPNASKQALRNVPDTINGGAGVSVIRSYAVENNLSEVVTNDRVFPMNTGGMEEFLKQTPRELNPDGSKNHNAEQQFGSGCFFTFGRNYAWPAAGNPWGRIAVDPVSSTGVVGRHRVNIQYNYEPSRRLKIYQFDPDHHDVAVYSLH